MKRALHAVAISLVLQLPLLEQAAAQTAEERVSTAADIFDRVERANAARAAALESYSATRRYSVFEAGHDIDAAMIVSMQFVAPSTKRFKTVSANGVGWIHTRVFRGLMDAEQQAAAGRERADSAISPANYEARLLGSAQWDGRECYLLELKPKRRDKYLFTGKAWIDKEDFGIARIEGEPVRSPSFWVVRAPFVTRLPADRQVLAAVQG